MMMYELMTPGPTAVAENVRMARSGECTNPDLDPWFYDYYRDTCRMFSELVHTENETLILGGEGILGLEAACASLTEPGDSALVLDNGVFGRGFEDFVSMYGGNAVRYTTDYRKPIDPASLRTYLEQDSDFKYATVVHCDTPSGMCNDVASVCRLLKSYGILTVVDSVSAMFGEKMDADDYQIDLLLGGSQKAISAPPGLTLVTISEEAKNAMKNRRTPIASFYANLKAFDGYYEKQWFPYTMPISDILGLRAALENIKREPKIVERHQEIAARVRNAVVSCGLKLYQKDGFCGAVTVFEVPKPALAADILDKMKTEHNILIAGSFDVMAGQVIRIGHMGENCRAERVERTLAALDVVLSELGVKLQGSLRDAFNKGE